MFSSLGVLGAGRGPSGQGVSSVLDEACRRDPEAGSDRVQDVSCFGFSARNGCGGKAEGGAQPKSR